MNFQNTLNFYNDTSLYATNLFVRLLTFLSILPTYMRLLFFPDILYIDRTADVVTSIININVIVSIVAIATLLLFCVKLRTKHPIFLFCFLWFFITMIPVSGIIPINGIIYEHFLYLPSVGIFLALSYLLYLAFERIKSPIFLSSLLLITFLLSLVFTIRTISRNSEWRDPITFYTQTIKHNPVSARLHNNLAMALADEGRNTEAIKEYKAAIQLTDVYPQTHYNLANSYLTLNILDEAEKEYHASLKIDPTFYRSYVSLTNLYKTTNQKEKLEKLIQQLETLSQKNPQLQPFIQELKLLQ